MKQFELDWRVFQAPIGSCCSVELVSAVSNAGGLGAFALTWKEPEEIVSLIQKTKELTSKPFQANCVLEFSVKEQVQAAIEAGVFVVTFSLGMPEKDLLCLLYTSPSPRDQRGSRMPSSA